MLIAYHAEREFPLALGGVRGGSAADNTSIFIGGGVNARFDNEDGI